MPKTSLAPLALLSAITFAAGLLLPAGPGTARSLDGWDPIGTARADGQRDRDEIEPRNEHTRYWGLRLSTSRGIIRLRSLEVRFRNGESRSFPIREEIDSTRPLFVDFGSENGRRISEIQIVHRTKSPGGRAVLVVDGELVRRPPAGAALPDSLKRLDQRRITGDTERVTFKVEREAGPFAALRFRSLGGRLRIERVAITFGNGERQDVRLNERIDSDRLTPSVDLEGRRRFVREVVVDVRRPPQSAHSSWLELLGLIRYDDVRPGVRDREPGIIVGNGRPGWRRQGWNEVSALRSTREPATSRVRIGRDSGRIEEIGIGAIRGTTYIRDVIVRFGNGEERRIAVDRRVDADRLVHRIRLERGRFIDRIEIEHRREGRGPAFSEFALLLRPAQGRRPFPDRPVEPPPPVSTDDWIKLGSRKAAMLSRDFDSIIVGRGEGRFSAVRIRVRRHDVRFYGMRIVFGNGETQTVPLFGRIRDGAKSQVIDLSGGRRFIQRIEFRYRTSFNLRGSGVIEIWGLR